MLRLLRTLAEILAAFVGVIVIVALLLIWRLSAHPVSSAFLTPAVVAAIEHIVPETRAEVARSLLTWDNTDHTVELQTEDIKIRDNTGEVIATIPQARASISVFGLLFGQLIPKELEIDHPQLIVQRDEGGAFIFAGTPVTSKASEAKENRPGLETVKEALHLLGERLIHATLMNKLSVTHVAVEIRDAGTKKGWTIALPEISIKRVGLVEATEDIPYGGLDGHLVLDVTQKGGLASLDLLYVYNPKTEQHRFSTALENLNPAFLAGGHPETVGLGFANIANLPISGEIALTFDRDLTLSAIDAQIRGEAGSLSYQPFWDHPVPVQSLDINLDYDRSANTLNIHDTRIDFHGPMLAINALGMASDKAGQDMNFKASMTFDNLPINRFAEIWPQPVMPNPREWMAANLADGAFSHAEVAVKGSLVWANLDNLTLTEAAGKMNAVNARVRYLDPMPAAENVNAEATFDLKTMKVTVTSGNVGTIHMKPTEIEISGLSDEDQSIHIPLQVEGPLPEILRLLDHQPLNYSKALGLSPEDIAGHAEGLVDFRFPLLRTVTLNDVVIKADAKITGLATSKLISGLMIDQGDLALGADTKGMTLIGNVALDKLPCHVALEQSFEPQAGKALRHVKITSWIKDNQWADLGLHFFEGTRGGIAAALDIKQLTKQKTFYSGSLDMGGAAMQVDMLGWKKPANQSAILTFDATAEPGKDIKIDAVKMHGDHLRLSGRGILSADGTQLLSLDLSPFIVGRNNIDMHFAQSFGEGGALQMQATGASLDVSALRGGHDLGQSDPRPKIYKIEVGRLYTSSNGFIDNARGHAARDQDGWRDISLHGLADGATPLSIELTPQADGHRTFQIDSPDFGRAMKGLGFTDTIMGGKIFVQGQSTVENPRLVQGHVKISDFTVKKLPVLALLLNATSPFGFMGIITDSADFSRFAGDFRWQGDSFALTKAHAAGSAVGINVDGKVNMNSGEAHVQGTLVPFSVVNSVLNKIPIIGDLLTGGENQGVLAVAYEINGPLDAPNITVNPISLLTPGFIRNLFFGDDSAKEDTHDE